MEHSIIRTFPLLNEIIRFFGRLFHEKTWYLELLPQFKLFPLSSDSLSYRESPIDLFQHIRPLLNK